MHRFLFNKKNIIMILLVSILILILIKLANHQIQNLKFEKSKETAEIISTISYSDPEIQKIMPYNQGEEWYQVGYNREGNLIFLNPDDAFNHFITDYKDEIEIVKKQNHFPKITKKNWDMYKVYAWQTNSNNDRCTEITRFFSIYEHMYVNYTEN